MDWFHYFLLFTNIFTLVLLGIAYHTMHDMVSDMRLLLRRLDTVYRALQIAKDSTGQGLEDLIKAAK